MPFPAFISNFEIKFVLNNGRNKGEFIFTPLTISYIVHRHLGPGYFRLQILSIKCASTTYMNPFDMLRCEINAFRTIPHFLDIRKMGYIVLKGRL